MKKSTIGFICLIVGTFAVLTLLPHFAFAQNFGGVGGDQLSQRVGGLTNDLISVVLPAISILGRVYAAILAVSGDQGAKGRMILIIVACIVGCLAPIIIHWLQGAVSGGGF